jgi:RHS repeat-associated protein
VLYYPYGETRYTEGTLQTDYQYTGQRNEAGLGLMDYNARYYDPALGRFVSADTIVPGTEQPQSWNRYAYVRNNPMAYVDPSGHMPGYHLVDGQGGNSRPPVWVRKQAANVAPAADVGWKSPTEAALENTKSASVYNGTVSIEIQAPRIVTDPCASTVPLKEETVEVPYPYPNSEIPHDPYIELTYTEPDLSQEPQVLDPGIARLAFHSIPAEWWLSSRLDAQSDRYDPKNDVYCIYQDDWMALPAYTPVPLVDPIVDAPACHPCTMQLKYWPACLGWLLDLGVKLAAGASGIDAPDTPPDDYDFCP